MKEKERQVLASSWCKNAERLISKACTHNAAYAESVKARVFFKWTTINNFEQEYKIASFHIITIVPAIQEWVRMGFEKKVNLSLRHTFTNMDCCQHVHFHICSVVFDYTQIPLSPLAELQIMALFENKYAHNGIVYLVWRV